MNNELKLSTEIIALSNAKDWNSAKLEWNFTHGYKQENSTCLCGKHPIINVCVITNHKNDNVTEVGNCCVKKFMEIEEGISVFNSMDRLSNDITKSIGADAVEVVYNNDGITDWEYSFYQDVFKKRKLSPKQEAVKIKINQKFLKYFTKKN